MLGKKGQGLSVNFIILIVIGLIIVGIMVFMIGSRVKLFGSATGSCVEKKGSCILPKACNGAIVGKMDCPKQTGVEDSICCVSYEESGTGGENAEK
jgi:hypothetical protein